MNFVNIIKCNLNILKWILSIIFVVSALLLTSNVSFSKIGFITFFIAHILSCVIFWAVKDSPLFYHNFIFVFIDIWGIYRWYF
jgi:hypothetical protein